MKIVGSHKLDKFPTHAIVAVTLNCNSRCVMCDIWKNHITNELQPEEYLKLPPSLIDINITGGEPFLRMDLPEIVAVMKRAAPKARLVLNTNGYLARVIEKQIPKILKTDPKFAVRVSLDGWEEIHDAIRRIPNGFKTIMETLSILDRAGVGDLGISFTIMKKNIDDLPKIFDFCRRERLELSLTMVTNSAIYFGEGKESLRPDNHEEMSKYLNRVIVQRFRSNRPKEWIHGWFEKRLLEYYFTHRRPLPCDAGEKFFYLDSIGNVYTCNIKSWLMGNIKKESFEQIWGSKQALKMISRVHACHDCWLPCSAKTSMASRIFPVGKDILMNKLSYALSDLIT